MNCESNYNKLVQRQKTNAKDVSKIHRLEVYSEIKLWTASVRPIYHQQALKAKFEGHFKKEMSECIL